MLAGSLCNKVDADYTSQACPRCGYTSKENRPKQGLLFVCQQCHYTLHADLVGARDVALRTLLIRQDWMRTGRLSDVPDVTEDEAKATRLKRYAELRWSPATSPTLERSRSSDRGSWSGFCRAPGDRGEWFAFLERFASRGTWGTPSKPVLPAA